MRGRRSQSSGDLVEDLAIAVRKMFVERVRKRREDEKSAFSLLRRRLGDLLVVSAAIKK